WIPAAWILLEWVRSFLLTGFPWLALGYSQVATPLGAYAPILGVYGAGFACMLVAFLLLVVVAPRSGLLARSAGVAAIIAVFAIGFGLGRIAWTHPGGPAFRVSLVQGNIAQTLKWEPDMFARSVTRYRDLTAAHWSSALIVWPEDAVPLWYEQAEPALDALAREARRHGSEVVLGVPVYDEANDAGYNAVVSLGSVHATYYKRHLVPFGEYFPVPDWIKSWLSAHALPYSSFTPGPWMQPPLAVGRWQAVVANCYEIAFGRLLITQLPAGEFILNLSDDGWFGNSIALPQQFQMARLAARATGRYVLAATDDGITGIIDERGSVLATLPTHTVGVLTGAARPFAGATPYVRMGNRGIVIACAFLVALALALALAAVLRRKSAADS
ncbi:MAG TPA: apolipoprotein N-acyltransferase, partial [Gammaproteobacteria bacterium]|nr:apolipoprotein N-acyltransferase [Gammaproteobacteria bacterium]